MSEQPIAKVYVGSIEFVIETETVTEFVTIERTDKDLQLSIRIPSDANKSGQETIWFSLEAIADIIVKARALFATKEAGRA